MDQTYNRRANSRYHTTPEIVWEFSATATALQFSEIEMSRTYAAGPFTVPTSGWYQLNFRTYFEVAFTSSVDPLAIPMAQMIFTVNTIIQLLMVQSLLRTMDSCSILGSIFRRLPAILVARPSYI